MCKTSAVLHSGRYDKRFYQEMWKHAREHGYWPGEIWKRRKCFVAIIYLNLDGFKAVNDTHGHAYGDRLPIKVASRMKKVVRGTDTVERLGGDEFVIALSDLPSKESSEPMLTRLIAAASKPMRIDHHQLQVSASIGVTFYPQTGGPSC